MTNDTEPLPDRDPCPDLPGPGPIQELRAAGGAAWDAIPDPEAFVGRKPTGPHPDDLEIVCNLCQERPPRPGDVLCGQCAPDNLLPAGARLAGGPRPQTHGQLVEEIARLREGCRKIMARALRELTCPPGDEAPRTALRAILDEAKALAEG